MDKPLRVLVVEDADRDAELLTHALVEQGFELVHGRVCTAEAMAAALDRERWDLVLAEHHLSRFDGASALRLMKDRDLDVPLIVTSTTRDNGEPAAAAAIAAGASDFISRPGLPRLGAVVTRELRAAGVRRSRRRDEAGLAFLGGLGQLVEETADHRELVRGAVKLAVPIFADFAILDARERPLGPDGPVEVAHAEALAVDPLRDLALRYAPRLDWGDHPLANVIRSRDPALFTSLTEETWAELARDEAHLRLLRELAPRSLVVVPLLMHDRVTGLFVFGAREPGRYDAADVAMVAQLAHCVGCALHSARLARAREEFISTAVHEIKTPITVIKAAVQLIGRTPVEQREKRMPETLARLERQCNRLTRLVTDVLEMSRIELRRVELARRPTDTAALVARVVSEMQGISPGHRLVICRNDRVQVALDADRIEQVLTNLVDNATKYSPAGGDVEITSQREGAELVVSVRDRGVGIPADKQARIFERFYRAHAGTPYEHSSSLGAGLYVSREFVRRHGGRMWFESREGEGATFSFSLPLPSEPGRGTP